MATIQTQPSAFQPNVKTDKDGKTPIKQKQGPVLMDFFRKIYTTLFLKHFDCLKFLSTQSINLLK